jgi:hypothetical protein
MNIIFNKRILAGVLVSAFALLYCGCSLFMVRDEPELDCFPTSVDFQQWMVREHPADVNVLETGSASDKALALEYDADKFYTALYEHKEEVAEIKFEVWHCVQPIDAWALASRFGSNNKAIKDDEIWSSPVFACSAKGNYVFRISSNAEYLISQVELRKAVLFARNKIKTQDFKITFIPEGIENVQFFRIGTGSASGFKDIFTGSISVDKEKVDIFWHTNADEQSAAKEYSNLMERTKGVTVVDYSGEKRMFFRDSKGFTAVIQKDTYLAGVTGQVSSRQALLFASSLMNILSAKVPKKRD